MTTAKIAYAADSDLSVSIWTTSLAAGQWGTSGLFDNTSNLYIDALVGGVIELDASTPVAGDSLDVYIGALYDKDTTNTATGGIDNLLDPGTPAEEVEDTDFVKNNLILFDSVSVEETTPATAQGYKFGPKGISQFFGGIMPQKFFLFLHNNTAGGIATGSAVNVVGVHYTNA